MPNGVIDRIFLTQSAGGTADDIINISVRAMSEQGKAKVDPGKIIVVQVTTALFIQALKNTSIPGLLDKGNSGVTPLTPNDKTFNAYLDKRLVGIVLNYTIDTTKLNKPNIVWANAIGFEKGTTADLAGIDLGTIIYPVSVPPKKNSLVRIGYSHLSFPVTAVSTAVSCFSSTVELIRSGQKIIKKNNQRAEGFTVNFTAVGEEQINELAEVIKQFAMFPITVGYGGPFGAKGQAGLIPNHEVVIKSFTTATVPGNPNALEMTAILEPFVWDWYLLPEYSEGKKGLLEFEDLISWPLFKIWCDSSSFQKPYKGIGKNSTSKIASDENVFNLYETTPRDLKAFVEERAEADGISERLTTYYNFKNVVLGEASLSSKVKIVNSTPKAFIVKLDSKAEWEDFFGTDYKPFPGYAGLITWSHINQWNFSDSNGSYQSTSGEVPQDYLLSGTIETTVDDSGQVKRVTFADVAPTADIPDYSTRPWDTYAVVVTAETEAVKANLLRKINYNIKAAESNAKVFRPRPEANSYKEPLLSVVCQLDPDRKDYQPFKTNTDTIIEQIVCSKMHNVPSNYANSLDIPIHQFLGSSSTIIVVKGKCLGLDSVTRLESINKAVLNQLKAQPIMKDTYPNYCYRLENGLTNLYGVDYVIPTGLEINTAHGQPDVYEFTMRFVEYQPAYSSDESLKPLETTWQNTKQIFNFSVKSGLDPLVQKAAEWFNVQSNLAKENLYPDLRLPLKSDIYRWAHSLREIANDKPQSSFTELDQAIYDLCKEFFDSPTIKKQLQSIKDFSLSKLREDDLRYADPDFFIFYNEESSWESLFQQCCEQTLGLPALNTEGELSGRATLEGVDNLSAHRTVFYDSHSKLTHIDNPDNTYGDAKHLADYNQKLIIPGVSAFPTAQAKERFTAYEEQVARLDNHKERWWNLSGVAIQGDASYNTLAMRADEGAKPYEEIPQTFDNEDDFYKSITWRIYAAKFAWDHPNELFRYSAVVQGPNSFVTASSGGLGNDAKPGDTDDLKRLKDFTRKLREITGKYFTYELVGRALSVSAVDGVGLFAEEKNRAKFANVIGVSPNVEGLEELLQKYNTVILRDKSDGFGPSFLQKTSMASFDWRNSETSSTAATVEDGNDGAFSNKTVFTSKHFRQGLPFWKKYGINPNLGEAFCTTREINKAKGFDLPPGVTQDGFRAIFARDYINFLGTNGGRDITTGQLRSGDGSETVGFCPTFALALCHIKLTAERAGLRENKNYSNVSEDVLKVFKTSQANIDTAIVTKQWGEVVNEVRKTLHQFGLESIITFYYRNYIKLSRFNGVVFGSHFYDPFFDSENKLIYIGKGDTETDRAYFSSDYTPSGEEIKVDVSNTSDGSKTRFDDAELVDFTVNGENSLGIEGLSRLINKVKGALNPATEDAIYGCVQDFKKYGKFNRLVKAFPSYCLVVINEGNYWANGGKKLWDQFYTRGNVSRIEVFKSKMTPTWSCSIVFSDLFKHSLNTTWLENFLHNQELDKRANLANIVLKPSASGFVDKATTLIDGYILKSGFVDKATTLIDGYILKNVPKEIADLWAKQQRDRILMGPGTRIQLRLGFGSNAAELPIVFNGTIVGTDITEGTFSVTAQGDGAELERQPAEASITPNNSFVYREGGAFGIGKSPASIVQEMLVGPNWLATLDHGYYRDWSKAGSVHFGEVVYQKGFNFTGGSIIGNKSTSIDLTFNIYDASNTKLEQSIKPIVNYFNRNALYNWDDVTYFSVAVKEPTTWKTIEVCRRAVLDFVAAPEAFAFRSTLFFGKWWWPFNYEYSPKIIPEISKHYNKPNLIQRTHKAVVKDGKEDKRDLVYLNQSQKRFDDAFDQVLTHQGLKTKTPKPEEDTPTLSSLEDVDYIGFMRSKPYSQFYICQSGINLFSGRVSLDASKIATDAIGLQAHNGLFSAESNSKTNVWSLDHNIAAGDRKTITVDTSIVTTSTQAPLKGVTDFVGKWLPGMVSGLLEKPTTPAISNSVIQSLCDVVKNMYQGWVTMEGTPTLKPRDFMLFNDVETRVQGPLLVKEVIHSFDCEVGFVTYFSPDLVVLPVSSIVGKDLLSKIVTGPLPKIGQLLLGAGAFALIKYKLKGLTKLAGTLVSITGEATGATSAGIEAYHDYIYFNEPEKYYHFLGKARIQALAEGAHDTEFIDIVADTEEAKALTVRRNMLKRLAKDEEFLAEYAKIKGTFSGDGSFTKFWAQVAENDSGMKALLAHNPMGPEDFAGFFEATEGVKDAKKLEELMDLIPYQIRARYAITRVMNDLKAVGKGERAIISTAESAGTLVRDTKKFVTVIRDLKTVGKSVKVAKIALSSNLITGAAMVALQVIGGEFVDGVNMRLKALHSATIFPMRTYKGVPFVAGIKGHQGAVIGDKPGLWDQVLGNFWHSTWLGVGTSMLTGIEYNDPTQSPVNEKMAEFVENERRRGLYLEGTQTSLKANKEEAKEESRKAVDKRQVNKKKYSKQTDPQEDYDY